MMASDIKIIPVDGCPADCVFLIPAEIHRRPKENSVQAMIRAAQEGEIAIVKNVVAGAAAGRGEGS